jgi:hypothetical protein
LSRGISTFKKGYQPITIIVKEEMGDMFTDSHGILAGRNNRFSQSLNVLGVTVVMKASTYNRTNRV